MTLIGKNDFLRVRQLVAGPYIEQPQWISLYIVHGKVTLGRGHLHITQSTLVS
jgi:hypothetical protein